MMQSLTKSQIEHLQKKRADVQTARDQGRLRSTYGARFVEAVAQATGKMLSVENFDNRCELSLVDWPSDIKNASGLVAAYTDKLNAYDLLACIRNKLGALSGRIGFHDKSYLGFSEIREIDPVSLLTIAESTEDSVVFFSDLPNGVIVVDCYISQPEEPFSIVVQGDELVQRLIPCFEK